MRSFNGPIGSHGALLTGVLVLALTALPGALVAANPSAATARIATGDRSDRLRHPIVSWTPSLIKLTVDRGGRAEVDVEFESRRDLVDVTLVPSRSISRFITLSDDAFRVVRANTPVDVGIVVQVPPRMPAGRYRGKVHVYAQGNHIARALPFTLVVPRNIYWADCGTDLSIGRASVLGANPQPLWMTNVGGPTGVDVNATHIFWSNQSGPAGSIGRANLDGTNPDTTFIALNDGWRAVSLDITATRIYWIARQLGPDGNLLPMGRIGRANLDGTNVNEAFMTVLQPSKLDVGRDRMYWSTDFGSIGRANTNGSGINGSFISGVGANNGIALRAGLIYWTDYEGDRIGRVSADGSGLDQNFLVLPENYGPFAVTVDAKHIYFGRDGTSSPLGRASLLGGAVEPFWISPQGSVCDVEVDPG